MAAFGKFLALLFFHFMSATSQSGPGQFTLTVYQPESSLHGQVVNAAGQAFYLGGSPASYCPLANQTFCPIGNQTIFAGMTSLFVEVPGGQQVYTTAAGALGFTQAHSASVPPGAYIGDFTNTTVVSGYGNLIYLINWQAPEAVYGVISKGIFACPRTSPGNDSATLYQVYANTPGFNQTSCTTVDGLLPHHTPAGVFGAWEYT